MGGKKLGDFPAVMRNTGLKSTVPLSNCRWALASQVAVRAPLAPKVSLEDRLMPRAAAFAASSVSVMMYLH